jgi:hypothetical protein
MARNTVPFTAVSTSTAEPSRWPLRHVGEEYNLPELDKSSLNKIYEEEPKLVPTSSGVTLEGPV